MRLAGEHPLAVPALADIICSRDIESFLRVQCFLAMQEAQSSDPKAEGLAGPSASPGDERREHRERWGSRGGMMTRTVVLLVWGALCGTGFCAGAGLLTGSWPPESICCVIAGSALGAVVAEALLARTSRSIQLLACAAILGAATTILSQTSPDEVFAVLVVALGVIGTSFVVDLFASRRGFVLRCLAACAVATCGIIVLITMVKQAKEGTFEIPFRTSRDWGMVLLTAWIGMAGVSPVSRASGPDRMLRGRSLDQVG